MIALLKSAVLPSNVIALLAILGLIAACFQRGRAAALPLLGAAGASYLFFANGVVATLLISPLEFANPAIKDSRPLADIRHIVVLTAFVSEDASMPTSGNLGPSAAFRVIEAAGVFRQDPNRIIVVSGSSVAARGMAAQLRELGVPDEHVLLEAASATTAESAANLASILGGQRAILVTSAGHMPRSLEALRRHGLDVVPFPTDYQLPQDWRDASWGISANHLGASDLAIHEHVGRIWYRLRDGA